MPRALPFILDGKLVTLEAASTVKREQLYGKARRLVEKDGEELVKGVLTPDGQLFRDTDFKRVQVDHDGSLTEETKVVAADGKEAPVYKSSAKEARPLQKINNSAFPELAVDSVIPVTVPAEVPEGFYSTSYTYNDSCNLQDAVLVVKPSGEGFILAGEKKESPFLEKGETYSFFDEEEETSATTGDDVDFTMF